MKGVVSGKPLAHSIWADFEARASWADQGVDSMSSNAEAEIAEK